MENGDRTGVNVVLEPQDNTGGSTIDPVDETPSDETNQDNDTTGGSETGRDSDCPPNCILGEDVEDASNEESALFGAKSLLLVLVVLLLLAVGLLTRGSEEDTDMGADQTVAIENEWQVEKKQFVPESCLRFHLLPQARKSDHSSSQNGAIGCVGHNNTECFELVSYLVSTWPIFVRTSIATFHK